MNLTEWMNSSEAERRRQIATWIAEDKSDNHAHLATEAADLLYERIGSLDGVSSVFVDDGPQVADDKEWPVCWLVLMVYTTLGNDVFLPEIPTEFFGFSVIQVNLGDKRAAFERVVVDVFRELLDWEESKTLEWLKDDRWAEGLDGRRPPLIYHDGPLKIAVRGLIEEEGFKNLGVYTLQLRNHILSIILEGARGAPDLLPESVAYYDWGKIRREYDSLKNKLQKQKDDTD